MIVLWSLLALLGAALAGAALYVCCSPMPVVRLLRKGPDAAPEAPPGYAARRARVRVQRDLAYPSRWGRNTFDLYLPKQEGPAPVILWAHGGAFVAGDKAGVEVWATCLASDGFAVAAMNYQWAPEARYPAQVAQLGECYAALQALARDGAPLDLARFAVAGDSAGAHMAAQFAALQSSAALQKDLGLPACVAPGTLRAALLYCGPYDVAQMASPQNRVLRLFLSRVGWSYLGKKRWQKSALCATTAVARYVTPAFPPCYLTDGNAHSFEGQGRALAAALKAQGVPVSTRFFPPNAGAVEHEYQFQLGEANADACYADTVRFLQTYLAPAQKPLAQRAKT